VRKVRFAIPAIVAGLAIGSTSAASAAEPFDFSFPAGEACPGFALGLNITPNPRQAFKEFEDEAGNVVRTISAGRGSELLFTNIDTDKTVSLTSNGSVSKTSFNPDGSSTVQATGHNVIILFPGDETPGPSTTLYEGRVVFTSTAEGSFKIISSSGPTRDICSELA
jgi:hypothetical protein